MADEQLTVEITTTHGGHKVIFKSFVTGYDKQSIGGIYLDLPDAMPRSQKFAKANERALETVIISVNGETSGVADLVMKMDARDTEEVVAKVNEITEDKKKEASTGTTSPTSSTASSPATS